MKIKLLNHCRFLTMKEHSKPIIDTKNKRKIIHSPRIVKLLKCLEIFILKFKAKSKLQFQSKSIKEQLILKTFLIISNTYKMK